MKRKVGECIERYREGTGRCGEGKRRYKVGKGGSEEGRGRGWGRRRTVWRR
jgi:hypothetical protein